MASKQKHLSLHEKMKIIEEWEKSLRMKKVEFAKKFEFPESALKGILASREKIVVSAQEFCFRSTSKRKKIQCGRSEEFDNALLQWFQETISSNIPISSLIFKENAIVLT